MKTITNNLDLIEKHDIETRFCSLMNHMRSCSSTYEQIIDKGEEIVPDILTYLRDNENCGMSIMMLLWDILKISPYTPKEIKNDKGENLQMLDFNVSDAKKAWVDWGTKQGLI